MLQLLDVNQDRQPGIVDDVDWPKITHLSAMIGCYNTSVLFSFAPHQNILEYFKCNFFMPVSIHYCVFLLSPFSNGTQFTSELSAM